MFSTLRWEDVLKAQAARQMWNLTFNAFVGSIDKLDRDWGFARYTSSNRLLTPQTEIKYSQNTFARRQATLYVWARTISATRVFENDENEEPNQLVPSGLYCWPGRGCPDQTGHNEFEVRRSEPGVSRAGFCVCTYISLNMACGAHLFALSNGWKMTLHELLRPEEVATPAYSIFFRH